MIWIAPKGCGEAPGHFPHQEKFHARFFKNCVFFLISGRISGYGPKYKHLSLAAFPQGLFLSQKEGKILPLSLIRDDDDDGFLLRRLRLLYHENEQFVLFFAEAFFSSSSLSQM